MEEKIKTEKMSKSIHTVYVITPNINVTKSTPIIIDGNRNWATKKDVFLYTQKEHEAAQQALQEHAANKNSKLCSREGCDKRWVYWNDNEFVCSEHNDYELKVKSEHADNKDGLQELEKWVWDNFMGDIPTKILTKISELKKSNTVINEHLELSELKNWVENQIERSPLGVSGSGAYRLAYSEILKKLNDKLKMINKVV